MIRVFREILKHQTIQEDSFDIKNKLLRYMKGDPENYEVHIEVYKVR